MGDGLFNFGSALIKIFFPDKTQVLIGENKLKVLEETGKLAQMAKKCGIALAEASSKDKWTSRGRPSVIYATLLFILLSIPFGIVNAISPSIAINIAGGIKLWFSITPPVLYECMTGIIITYTICRTSEKKAGVAK